MIAGIIEGFYGPPWTHQERLRNIDLLAEYGGNTYVWAAKLEPRHRELWAEPFTELELTEFTELSIRQKTVQVLIGLTPGADATTEQVINKLQPAINHGCHGLVLSFDDLPALDAAAKHQEIANALIENLKTQVWLVPTHYAGITSSPYLEQLLEGLHPEVLVMWTGVHVVNDSIHAHEARQRTQACHGRKPLLWDNTPVNDAMMSEALHLGPYAGREAELRSEITGLLINPMEFATASQPTLVSALAWVNDGEPYSAWLNFIDQRGWTEFARCTAFPDDPHWPGARPSDDWWQSVVNMNPLGLEAGCEPWIDAAKQGAQLVLDARRLLDPALPRSQSTVLKKITLAMRWRSWQRLPVLLYGGGPRLRPVIINDEHGEFVYRHGSVISTTCLVDDEIMRCLHTD